MSGPADSKSVPGFDNWPRFVGVIEQNKISDSYENYCITYHAVLSSSGSSLKQVIFIIRDLIRSYWISTRTWSRRDHQLSTIIVYILLNSNNLSSARLSVCHSYQHYAGNSFLMTCTSPETLLCELIWSIPINFCGRWHLMLII